MTILTAAQSAMARLVGRKPAAVVSSQNEMEVEITDLAQEAAVEIMKSHDWQKLTKVYTINADGTTTEFPLPSDYDRMLLAAEIYDQNSWAWGYQHITDYQFWLTEVVRGFYPPNGAWMMRGDVFMFAPAPVSGAVAAFPYISNQIFTATNGAPKARLDSDSDTFVLDERLLTLSLIWRWKQLKGLDYAEDLRTYENALSQQQARDGGSRVMRRNAAIFPANTVAAWPWNLGPEYP